MIKQKPFKNFFYIFSMAVSLLIPVQSAVCGPRITFDSTNIYWGRTGQGKKLEVIINFRNTGDDTLSVVKVENTCPHCPAGKLKRHKIAKGETGAIEFHSEISDQDDGVIFQNLLVHSNDTASGPVKLTLYGYIRKANEPWPPWLDIQPNQLVLSPGYVAVGVKIGNSGQSALNIVSAYVKNGLFEISSFQRLIPAGQFSEITLRTKRPAIVDTGSYQIIDSLILFTNVPERPRWSFPIFGLIRK